MNTQLRKRPISAFNFLYELFDIFFNRNRNLDLAANMIFQNKIFGLKLMHHTIIYKYLTNMAK